jgi:tRNA threonylcarbamoyl adenosine modification protein YjeE
MIVSLPSIRATRALARKVAKTLDGRELRLLSGDLGTGKTTFVGYLAEALAIARGWVSSPSFALVQRYPAGGRGFAVTHVDLYRIAGAGDLESLGLEEILASEDLVIVEWPLAAEALWADSGRRVIRIEFRRSNEGKREALINEGRGEKDEG